MLIYLSFVFSRVYSVFSCIILRGGQKCSDISDTTLCPGINLCIHWVKCLSVKILMKNVRGFAICSFHKSITIIDISGFFGDPIEQL